MGHAVGVGRGDRGQREVARELPAPGLLDADSDVAVVCPLVWIEIAPYFGVDPSAGDDAGGRIA